MDSVSKWAMILGGLLVFFGVFTYVAARFDIHLFNWFGKLPLDIRLDYPNINLYIPIGSSIAISLVLSLLLWLLRVIGDVFGLK